MSGGSAIQLEAVSKRWGTSRGVEQLHIDIPRGSFVALLGPSGCGKSTTLRLVAGLETADSGRIIIDGRDVTGAPPAARSLSMVFQSYALFPHLNVTENIVFGLKVRRFARADRQQRLDRALALTGLEGLERRKPAELSGGQRQRVALARAIVADHPLCLMDEPLSNLDAKLRHSVRQDIRALQRRLGMTVLYVTHDQTEAMAMADVVVLMKEGRIEQMGPPAELYRRPATAFAASFVGSPPMALLPAEAVPAIAARLDRPERALAGLRPEALRLAPEANGLAAGRVRDAEFLGAETFVTVDLDEAGPLTVRLPGGAEVAPGSRVGIAWDWTDLHLFDRESGARLPGTSDVAAVRAAAAATGTAPAGG